RPQHTSTAFPYTTLFRSFIGPRLPIVMGVFYIFIGPIVAIGKEINLAAAMTALIIGGAVQFAWSPLIGKLHRFFPPIVTGTTILDRKSTRLNSSHVAISY